MQTKHISEYKYQHNHFWWQNAIVYHLYPLGYCNAPHNNDFSSPASNSIEKILNSIERIKKLGCDTLLLGPVFESSSHGYDTVDWWNTDRRLGNNDSLENVINKMHQNGIRVVFDGVFHHVGRDFWAFYKLRNDLENSEYKTWFSGVDFSSRGQRNDGFSYESWEGHDDLIKLNLNNPALKDHLFGAVKQMIMKFDIDGLRLDVAYSLEKDFIQDLASFCRSLKPDFWLMGEVIHGDYKQWMKKSLLDSVTNYELYKALWSSIIDKNYFELAWACKRQFTGKSTRYNGLLYNFGDNHDVMRLASRIHNPKELRLLYAVLWMLPGIPSVYYGSESGCEGEKNGNDDWALRPPLELLNEKDPGLEDYIALLSKIRRKFRNLEEGDYKEICVSNLLFGFLRKNTSVEASDLFCLFNLDNADTTVEIPLNGTKSWICHSIQNESNTISEIEIEPNHNGGTKISIPGQNWVLLTPDCL